ncbi:hypothetical protein ES703_59036 [subsurface metagenome]
MPRHPADGHLITFRVNQPRRLSITPRHNRRRPVGKHNVTGRPTGRISPGTTGADEFFTGYLGTSPVSHGMTVSGQLMGRIPQRPEAATPGTYHGCLRLKDIQVVVLHGNADGANNPSVLLQQLGNRDSVQNLNPTLNGLLPQDQWKFRVPVDAFADQGRELFPVNEVQELEGMGKSTGLAVFFEKFHPPRIEVLVTGIRVPEHDFVPFPVVNVLTNGINLLHPGIQLVTPLRMENRGVAGEGSLA